MKCIMCGTEIKTINEKIEKKSLFGTKTEFQQFKYCEKCGYKEQIVTEGYINASEMYETDHYKGLSIASIICGIVSLFLFPFILGVLGIVFGGVAKGNGSKSSMATAGIICGVISLIWAIFIKSNF